MRFRATSRFSSSSQATNTSPNPPRACDRRMRNRPAAGGVPSAGDDVVPQTSVGGPSAVGDTGPSVGGGTGPAVDRSSAGGWGGAGMGQVSRTINSGRTLSYRAAAGHGPASLDAGPRVALPD